jgi:hypothetical protein
MLIPAVLRRDIGTDYPVYVTIFNRITYSADERVEYGFYLLNTIFKTIDFDVQWVFGIMAFLTLSFLFRAVPRKSFYFIIPFYYMMLYTAAYNIVRQSLVVTMVYYAYRLFEQKKLKRALFCIAAAMLFHRSAVLYFALFLLMIVLKMRKEFIIILFCFILLLMMYINPVIDFIFQKFIFYTIYANYINNIQYNAATNNAWYATVSRYLVFMLLLIFMPNNRNKEMSNVCILFLCYIFSYILGQNILIFGRLSTGFSFAWFPVIHYINSYKTKYTKFVFSMLFCWGFVYFIFSLKGDMNGIIPYRSIF